MKRKKEEARGGWHGMAAAGVFPSDGEVVSTGEVLRKRSAVELLQRLRGREIVAVQYDCTRTWSGFHGGI